MRTRIFAILLIIACAALTYYNWYQLNTEGKYSTKLATFGPVCVIGGLFLLVFPSKVGKPTTTSDKIIVLAVLAIGLLAGLLNWYLMDPGFFGR
jgi:CDP-diglyceride synthetase